MLNMVGIINHNPFQVRPNAFSLHSRCFFYMQLLKLMQICAKIIS